VGIIGISAKQSLQFNNAINEKTKQNKKADKRAVKAIAKATE
jgi:predicted RND superfamily exporter protein